MADISKEDLRKEIAAILKDADLASTSAKKVRQELEEKLDVKLQSRKKEIDDLVMQFVSSKKDGGKKKGKKDDSEEDGGEEDEEEEDEEEEPVQVVNFTYQEMTDMLLVFGRVKGNSEKARRLYGDTFPGRRLPDHTIFDSLYQGLQQYGCFPEIITYYGHPKEVVSKSPKNYMKPKPELAALVGADSMPRCKVVKKGAKKGGGGYIKRFQLSPELSALVGAESMAYHEVVKKVWTIIKEKNLFDPENRQYAICDDSLMKVIGTRRFRTFVQVVDFTYDEMTDMVLVYGRVLGKSLNAQRLYGDMFPERRLPDHTIFDRLCQSLRQYGCFPERITYYGRPKEVVSKSPENYMKPKPELAAPVGVASMPQCKVVEKGANKGAGAYTRRVQLSPELSALVGTESMARHEVVKKIWSIIKEKNLYDPKDKTYAICDDSLMKVIGTRRFRTFVQVVNFTYEEMADMHLAFGRVRGNSLKAQQLYGDMFPERRLPDHTIFDRIHQSLQQDGCFPERVSSYGCPQEVVSKSPDNYMKPLKLSPELAALVGADSMPRYKVVKTIWTIIKEKNLYDPKNKQYAICDDALLKVIGTRRFRTFGMMKYLKNHFIT